MESKPIKAEGDYKTAVVFDRMEKDLIFPQFCRRRGETVIQGFEVFSLFSIFRYLVRRFKYKGTTLIRYGDTVYDLEGKRQSKIRLGRKSFHVKKGFVIPDALMVEGPARLRTVVE